MIQYEWKIQPLVVLNGEYEGMRDIVVSVPWLRIARLDGQSACLSGSEPLSQPDPANCTPFEMLTREQVISWVEASMGAQLLAENDARLAEMIEVQVNPPFIVKTPPWQKEATDALAQ